MPTVRLELSEALLDRLRRERDLLGFEDVETYVRWVVDGRAAIESDADTTVVDAYERRIEDLEARVADLPDDEQGEGGTTDGGDAGKTPPAGGPAADGEGEVEGESKGKGEMAANLSPATARVGGDADAVADLAAALAGVTDDRLDEITRRAVARTREQLGGDGGGSGLSYDATNALRSDGPPPGADVTDLGALDVPGHDDRLLERRRRAIGAALAYLKEAGEARRSDFVEALYDDRPAGYDTADGWWRCVKRGLSQVDRVDGAGPDSRIWRFRDVHGRVRVL
ncbi:hypothetical protein BRD13_05650 [Halobacteriales archaeon SW_5_70_135]|nr:MAG: hypothetical protein BRD13_05650 [Halobacteriales archaeon SW_5_70_135]